MESRPTESEQAREAEWNNLKMTDFDRQFALSSARLDISSTQNAIAGAKLHAFDAFPNCQW